METARTTDDPRLAAVADLRKYDHAFLSEKGADHFAMIFGLKAHCYRHTANPNEPKGLTLKGGAKSAIGIGAHELAEDFCRQLHLPYREMFGRGSQLHECCDALEKFFLEPRVTP